MKKKKLTNKQIAEIKGISILHMHCLDTDTNFKSQRGFDKAVKHSTARYEKDKSFNKIVNKHVVCLVNIISPK